VLTFLYGVNTLVGSAPFVRIGIAALVQGFGTAIILAIVNLVRDRDEQTRAAASAEVRALQSRMNPHFLFNALNTLAALATVAPREIPRAAGRLRHFLRASFDQHEREFVSLGEELAVVRAYLDIESLRLGSRLKVEQDIEPGLSDALIPPFSFQPLVENAVQHGIQSSPEAGCLRLVVRRVGGWLEMSIRDDGRGVPSRDVQRVFFEVRPCIHALSLLRRRLQGLFGHSYLLEVASDLGRGTTVRMRVPVRGQLDAEELLEAASC
jgi:LytS/YehU family sensor histidine kinase